MFHHVVLANDDEESVADDDATLCVSARTNLGARCSMLDLTKMLQLLRPLELVCHQRVSPSRSSGAVSTAHSSATSSSTPANSERRCYFAGRLEEPVGEVIGYVRGLTPYNMYIVCLAKKCL